MLRMPQNLQEPQLRNVLSSELTHCTVRYGYTKRALSIIYGIYHDEEKKNIIMVLDNLRLLLHH